MNTSQTVQRNDNLVSIRYMYDKNHILVYIMSNLVDDLSDTWIKQDSIAMKSVLHDTISASQPLSLAKEIIKELRNTDNGKVQIGSIKLDIVEGGHSTPFMVKLHRRKKQARERK